MDPDFLQQLREELGDGSVLVGQDCQPYETGARFDRGRAAFVLRPSTVEHLSRATALCVRRGVPLVPQSANTGVVSGSTPDGSGDQAVVSLDRLRKNVEIDRANRSVHLDAGLRLSELNERLAPHGLFFPIDIGADPLIGGMVSTNTGGARFIRYGDVRRNVLGLKLVLPDEDGTILDLCSHVRKSNTGVDWKQLFIGTCGAFGIVAECVLNLERLPRQRAAALIVPGSQAAIMEILERLEESFGSQLTAFEGISAAAIEAAIQHVPGLRNPFPGGTAAYSLLVEVSRTWEAGADERSVDDWLQSALSTTWEANPDLFQDVLFGPIEQFWNLRHAVSEGVKSSGKLVAFDIAFRRGDLPTFIEQMSERLAASFPEVVACDFGHVGDGGLHFNLTVPWTSQSASDPDLECRLRAWLYPIVVEEFGGSFSAEHGIGRKNQAFHDKFTNPKLKSLARALKAEAAPGRLGTATFW